MNHKEIAKTQSLSESLLPFQAAMCIPLAFRKVLAGNFRGIKNTTYAMMASLIGSCAVGLSLTILFYKLSYGITALIAAEFSGILTASTILGLLWHYKTKENKPSITTNHEETNQDGDKKYEVSFRLFNKNSSRDQVKHHNTINHNTLTFSSQKSS